MSDPEQTGQAGDSPDPAWEGNPEGEQAGPLVLTFNVLDPTGGGGLVADVEALASQGAFVAAAATGLVQRDTQQVLAVEALEPMRVLAQARTILEDMPVALFKVGALLNLATLEAVDQLLGDYPDTALVIDPKLDLCASDWEAVELGRKLLATLGAEAEVVVLDQAEAWQLMPTADSPAALLAGLLELGPFAVLVTGLPGAASAGERGSAEPQWQHLYRNRDGVIRQWQQPRVEGRFYGAGDTLSAAIAGLLAQGEEPLKAIDLALDYSHQALASGVRLGMGRSVPQRLFWTEEPAEEDLEADDEFDDDDDEDRE